MIKTKIEKKFNEEIIGSEKQIIFAKIIKNKEIEFLQKKIKEKKEIMENHPEWFEFDQIEVKIKEIDNFEKLISFFQTEKNAGKIIEHRSEI